MIQFDWDPVELDCLGLPDSGVHYEVAYMFRECDLWWKDSDSIFPPFCSTLAWRRTQDDTSFRSLGADPPPVGAAIWWEITAIDGAGNRDTDPCQ